MLTGEKLHDGSGEHPAPTGLVLTGGGARASYQVGVVSALLDILDPDEQANYLAPFSVICGTSAGAINAASLASHAHHIHAGKKRLTALWSALETGDVYGADGVSLLRTGLRWLGMLSLGWVLPRLRAGGPRSFLDNSPLRRLLQQTIDFEQIATNISTGALDALAITAAAYNTGDHLTFYHSNIAIKPWQRSDRKAIPGRIGLDHLMASSAIPFVFPAQPLLVRGRTRWCGDGSMRQLAPLSPAIHLGAERVVVIGTGADEPSLSERGQQVDSEYPSLALIGGHALSNIFVDGLDMDIERMHRINELLLLLDKKQRSENSLRLLKSLVFTPSRSLDDIALEHFDRLPPAARTLFRVLGVSSSASPATGGTLISYLLFEAGYTQELIALGRRDAFQRVDEVKAFFRE